MGNFSFKTTTLQSSFSLASLFQAHLLFTLSLPFHFGTKLDEITHLKPTARTLVLNRIEFMCVFLHLHDDCRVGEVNRIWEEEGRRWAAC